MKPRDGSDHASGIALENVTFSHEEGGAPMAFDAAVPSGAVCLVTGPSGSGKSTLLALVAGFEQPRSGRVMIGGRDWTGRDPAERPVTMVFQEHNLFPHLDIATNIALGIAPRRRITASDLSRVAAAMDRVGLTGMGGRLPGALSGGERQRAALARAVLRDRPVLLLDEPFAALGPALRSEMLALMTGIASERQATVLLVSHQPLDATPHASMVLFLEGGRVHKAGGPDILRSDDAVIDAYLGTGVRRGESSESGSGS